MEAIFIKKAYARPSLYLVSPLSVCLSLSLSLFLQLVSPVSSQLLLQYQAWCHTPFHVSLDYASGTVSNPQLNAFL